MAFRPIFDKFLRTLDNLECGTLTLVMPDDKIYHFDGKQPGAHGHIHIHDNRTFAELMLKGDIGFTETYRKGWWSTDDLCELLLVGLQNERALDQLIYAGTFTNIIARIMYFFQQNSMRGSKKNIHAHYDIGNDFYQLWLDPSMSYSSALFSKEGEGLEQAQYNKYDRIIERLGQPSGRLLEVGCGWGGFAERALHYGDYGVKAITLSQEQHDYAIHRLNGQADIMLEDYRIQTGKYDHIVSIEMFEAVGEAYWQTYFGKLKELLADKGKAVVQTITIGDDYFERYRKTGDMIRTYIFPGGMLPSPSRFEQEAQKAGLRITNDHAFGHDYAATLKHWLVSFEDRLSEVRDLGFDEGFIRIWRFYLAACFASFKADRTDVMQMELQHA